MDCDMTPLMEIAFVGFLGAASLFLLCMLAVILKDHL